MSIGKTITLLRKEKGLSQVEFAAVLNIDKSTIAKYETDRILPSVPMLIKIAQFFDVSSDYLLGLED